MKWNSAKPADAVMGLHRHRRAVRVAVGWSPPANPRGPPGTWVAPRPIAYRGAAMGPMGQGPARPPGLMQQAFRDALIGLIGSAPLRHTLRPRRPHSTMIEMRVAGGTSAGPLACNEPPMIDADPFGAMR